jgi:hypothetical protein
MQDTDLVPVLQPVDPVSRRRDDRRVAAAPTGPPAETASADRRTPGPSPASTDLARLGGPDRRPSAGASTLTLGILACRRLVWLALALMLAALGGSVTDALAVPGSDSVAARLAEWGRDNGFDGVITALERASYHPPPTGGEPVGGIALPAGTLAAGGSRAMRAPGTGLPAPGTMATLTGGPALPGEGVWHPVSTVHGHPAVEVANMRPDPQHTSFLAGLMWIDPTFVRGQLQPGYKDPGGHWPEQDKITPTLQTRIVAAFNAGFRLNGAAEGGYYADGRTAVPLRNGAASLVLDKDGTARVGAWNRDVRMGPEVASVRQNLVLLVDRGTVNHTCASGGTKQWGSTIGQVAYIHRSGFGVTADGAEVYVGGPALSVCSLGNLLKRAGVVEGMELDINPAWVSGAYFHLNPHGVPPGFRLFPAEQVSPAHYFSPSSRDWYGWYARH